MTHLGRGRQDGEHQAGAVHARLQPHFVAGVRHHGAQQEQASRIGQTGDEHGDRRQGEVAAGNQGRADVEDGEDQAGHGQGAILADLGRQPGPDGRPDQAGHEVDQHEQRRLGVVVALDLTEEEEQQRPGDARRDAQQQVGDQQLAHRLHLEQGQVGARPAVRCGARVDRLGDGDHGQADGQRQGDDDGTAHNANAVDVVSQARLHHDGRQDQDKDHADDVEHLPPAVDATALVVLRRQHGGPAQLAQGSHRKAEVEHQQPGEQIDRPGARLDRHEHHQRRQHQDRRRHRHPRAIAAQTRARLVHAPADEGVEHDVDQPHGHEDSGHHAHLHADMGGVEFRQSDRQGHAEGRQRQARA
ncbi:Uncharacterised protein [Brevundimonas diminuta]|uniref:Uncharacterized protein n=1 Tax=Brevundimonas diminuta TaxID=293 RepID=A0A2X1CHI1_BREDI|nr:Uncharacterised protein [Brevundimonas diminuta]